MKSYISFLQLSILLSCPYFYAMDTQAKSPIFAQATSRDISKIVALINTQAYQDHNKIVILPEKFREESIKTAVERNRLYIAKSSDSGDIIAFKKLFIIENEQEYTDIATHEIRCTGPDSLFVSGQQFSSNQTVCRIKQAEAPSFSLENSVIIYFGGDYTVPAYRNQKINSNLTEFAFATIKTKVSDALTANNTDTIALVYGLTGTNAGEGPESIDRTPSIVRAFKRFIGQESEIYHLRYKSFMPTFDPQAEECKPLPDDQAIAGYGNVLIFPLSKHETQGKK